MHTQLHNSSSIRPKSTWSRPRARLALSALVLVGVGAAYGQTPARWIGGSADWSDAGCWDIGVVPNNAGAATYVAIVDVPAQVLQISVTNVLSSWEILRINSLPAAPWWYGLIAPGQPASGPSRAASLSTTV
jgi:hypothetical protein